jgi:hypothetical protein
MYILKTHDTFNPSQSTTIEIYCPNRGIDLGAENAGVIGIIPKDLTFIAKSNWEPAFGALKDNAYFSTVDTLAQFAGGISVNQPFLARKVWKGSEPFQFKVDISFIAQGDAKTDVYIPMTTLMGFCLPRNLIKGSNSQTGDVGAFTIPGPNPLIGTGYVGFASNVTGSQNRAGDYVNVRIGNYLARLYCFITDVSVKISSVLDPSGYPQYAVCSTTISTMDAMYLANGKNTLGVDPNATGAPLQGFNIKSLAE